MADEPLSRVEEILEGGSPPLLSRIEKLLQEGGAGGGTGLTEDVKQALLDCFENVAWINDDGQDYYDALKEALYPPANLSRITAVFSQGNNTIYDSDSLNSLKQHLTVTATYSNGSTQTLGDNAYTLSGTLTEGTSVITVSYGGKTTTFSVVVSSAGWVSGQPYRNIDTVSGCYVDANNGDFIEYTTWSRTEFVPCAGAVRIVFPCLNSASNAFYDANHKPVIYANNKPGFALYGTPGDTKTINVPAEAAYFVLSGENAEINAYFDTYDCIPYSSS